jgi:nitroreductase/NAD-dependent dihydropyrimidine dehydrogenase PreA subunit
MKTGKSFVQHDTCKVCAFCVSVCPNALLEVSDEKKIIFRPEFSNLCVTCGHCMAVCTTNSINIEGLSYEIDIFDVEKKTDEFDFFSFVQNRRAIRNYKSKPLTDEIINKIIEGMSLAPMGFPPHKISVTVVTNKEVIDKAQKIMVDFYAMLGKMLQNPIANFFIKRKISAEQYSTIKNHVVPSLSERIDFYNERKIDAIMRDAPAIFLLHADKFAENHSEDAMIALTYGILAAHSLNIGSCPVSLIPPAVNKDKQLKQLFKIPDNNEVVASFIAGYAKYPYKKGIKRKLPKVDFI